MLLTKIGEEPDQQIEHSLCLFERVYIRSLRSQRRPAEGEQQVTGRGTRQGAAARVERG